MEKIPLIAIVGPTAVGKTALSIELAKEFDCEIISIDSVQIYKKFDIGSAKVKKEEMEYDEKYLDFKTLVIMGIATSLDSLLVGLTFSILPFYQTFLYTVEIGVITAIIAGLGFILGDKFGNILGQKSHFLGAALLIFISINILI